MTPFPFEHVDHIGIVVVDLARALATFQGLLGFPLLERHHAPEHGVDLAFLDAGNLRLELLQPIDPTSGTARFLARRGEGPHHVCFAVPDIHAALERLRDQGLTLVDEVPRRGIHGLVAFVHPKATHGLMIELLQRQDP